MFQGFLQIWQGPAVLTLTFTFSRPRGALAPIKQGEKEKKIMSKVTVCRLPNGAPNAMHPLMPIYTLHWF